MSEYHAYHSQDAHDLAPWLNAESKKGFELDSITAGPNGVKTGVWVVTKRVCASKRMLIECMGGVLQAIHTDIPVHVCVVDWDNVHEGDRTDIRKELPCLDSRECVSGAEFDEYVDSVQQEIDHQVKQHRDRQRD